MAQKLTIALVVLLLGSTVASAGALAVDNQTITATGSEDTISVGASMGSQVNDSQVVYLPDATYRPGVVTASRLAGAGDDEATVVSDGYSDVDSLLSDTDQFEGVYAFEYESKAQLSAVTAEEYYDSADTAYVAEAGNQTDIALVLYEAQSAGAPLILANGSESAGVINQSLTDMGVRNLTASDQVNVSSFESDRNVTTITPSVSDANSEAQNGTVYVVNSVVDHQIATAYAGPGQVFLANDNTTQSDLPSNATIRLVYEPGEALGDLNGTDIVHESPAILSARMAHIANGVNAPTVAVSSAEKTNTTTNVTVDNVGNATATGIVLEVTSSENVSVSGAQVTSSSYENSTLTVNLTQIDAGETTEVVVNTTEVSDVRVTDYSSSSGGSAVTFTSFNVGVDAISESLQGLADDVREIGNAIGGTLIALLLVFASISLAVVYYIKER